MKMNRTRRKGLRLRDRAAAGFHPDIFPTGCGGVCCSVLSLSTKDGESFASYVIRAQEAMVMGCASKGQRESLFLADLFQPVTIEQAQAIRPEVSLSPWVEWFTCRWWDPVTTLCRNHDIRPYFCREFKCRSCDYAQIKRRQMIVTNARESIETKDEEKAENQ